MKSARLVTRHKGLELPNWMEEFRRTFNGSLLNDDYRMSWQRPDGTQIDCYWISIQEIQTLILPPSNSGKTMVETCNSVWRDIQSALRGRSPNLEIAEIVDTLSDETLAEGHLKGRNILDASPGIGAGIAGLVIVLAGIASWADETPVLASAVLYLIIAIPRPRRIAWELAI